MRHSQTIIMLLQEVDSLKRRMDKMDEENKKLRKELKKIRSEDEDETESSAVFIS